MALLIFLLFVNISSSFSQDVYLDAMKDEIKRSMDKLFIKDSPLPYFISYLNYDDDVCEISSSFGDIEYTIDDRRNRVKTDLRVGTIAFDNSNYAPSLSNYFAPYSFFPDFPDYDLVRYSLWLLTDEAYKKSLELFSAKEGYMKTKDIKQYPEILKLDKFSYIENVGESKKDCRKFEGVVRKISMLSRNYNKIKNLNVNLNVLFERKRYVNSYGSYFMTFNKYYTLNLYIELLDKNGYLIKDNKDFIFTDEKELNDKLIKKVDQYLTEVSSVYDSEVIDYYLGPAVFEEDASAMLFNNLFVRNISFYPPVETQQENYLMYYYDLPKLVDRIGRRVLSPFIDVYDDPHQKEYMGSGLAGYYFIDDDGVFGERVELVKDGILKNIYTSNRGSKYALRSNGHSRGGWKDYNYPTSSNVFVISKKQTAYDRLLEYAKKIAKEENLDKILIVKKISQRDDLIEPVIAYLIDINTGKKTYLSPLKFDGINLRTLRDIVYTEDKYFVYNFKQRGPFYNSGEIFSSIVMPRSILISEVELIKSDKKPEKKPYVPHPYFEKNDK